jgi:hypothetical protein
MNDVSSPNINKKEKFLNPEAHQGSQRQYDGNKNAQSAATGW